MSNEVVRFLHSADLHLDSPYKGLRNLPNHIFQDMKDSTLVAYRRLIDLAIDQQVDFVLIVGDLFDQESNSIKALIELKRGLEKLNKYNIQAYISFGNHDYMMMDKAELNFPSNTYVFPSKKISNVTHYKEGQPLVELSGFSYWTNAVNEKMVEQYDKKTHAPYHIATLHGSIQSNLEHDTYAPFLLEDLKRVPADYWALGHIHTRDVLMEQPYAVYPGNIQGRHINETGDKGCYVVEMTKNGTDMQFHSLQDVTFQVEELNLKCINKVEELYNQIEKVKLKYKQKQEKLFVRLNILLDESNLELTREQEEDLLNLINDAEEDEMNWIWVKDIQLSTQLPYNREELKLTNPFLGEILQTIDEQDDLDEYIEELLNHRTFNKYMNWDTDHFRTEIKKEAEKIIIRELLKNG